MLVKFSTLPLMRWSVSSLIQKTINSSDALQTTLKELPSITVSDELTILTTDARSKNEMQTTS